MAHEWQCTSCHIQIFNSSTTKTKTKTTKQQKQHQQENGDKVTGSKAE
jgi:hypothetical protein